jgi:exportin-1
LATYKGHLRDFLITSREQSGSASDNADLFQEDKEAKAAAEREQAAKVPGMLKP